MRLDGGRGLVLPERVARVAHEGVVALDAELVRRGVEAEVDGEAVLGEFSGVAGAAVALRHLGGVHQLREHHRRHEVRDHALAGDVRPVLERDALYLIVLHVDLRDLGVVPDVAAQLTDARRRGRRAEAAAGRLGRAGRPRPGGDGALWYILNICA